MLLTSINSNPDTAINKDTEGDSSNSSVKNGKYLAIYHMTAAHNISTTTGGINSADLAIWLCRIKDVQTSSIWIASKHYLNGIS